MTKPKTRCCDTCGHVHHSRLATAVGRFNPSTPTRYRADHDGSPIRATRSEAEQDQCERWANDRMLP